MVPLRCLPPSRPLLRRFRHSHHPKWILTHFSIGTLAGLLDWLMGALGIGLGTGYPTLPLIVWAQKKNLQTLKIILHILVMPPNPCATHLGWI